MVTKKIKKKFKVWLRRYIIAELLGTLIALGFASVAFSQSHSYLKAAGAGFVGEGIGFFGYFIISELVTNSKSYKSLPFYKRISRILAKSSTNLIVEFAPAEIIDNIFIRPFLMYTVPQYIKPYALGFIIGKLSADLFFYIFAIIGLEIKQHMHAPKKGV